MKLAFIYLDGQR